MLGEEQVEEYQEHSRLIVARLRDAQGDDFEWADWINPGVFSTQFLFK